jgi:hypothetical protein
MSTKITEFLRQNSEQINVFLLLGFIAMIMYILFSCVDPAEAAMARKKEVEFSKSCQKIIDKEIKEQERYQRLLKKINQISQSHSFDTQKSLITNLNANEENIAVKVSKYINDRGGYQFRGQPGNWYNSFAEQARMLYR